MQIIRIHFSIQFWRSIFFRKSLESIASCHPSPPEVHHHLFGREATEFFGRSRHVETAWHATHLCPQKTWWQTLKQKKRGSGVATQKNNNRNRGNTRPHQVVIGFEVFWGTICINLSYSNYCHSLRGTVWYNRVQVCHGKYRHILYVNAANVHATRAGVVSGIAICGVKIEVNWKI